MFSVIFLCSYHADAVFLLVGGSLMLYTKPFRFCEYDIEKREALRLLLFHDPLVGYCTMLYRATIRAYQLEYVACRWIER